MNGRRVTVSVVWATPDVQDVVPLELPAGATAATAVAASGLARRYAIDLDTTRIGINGRLARPDTVLGAGDRVEICRPLVADPKAARRARALAKPLGKAPHKGRASKRA